MMTHSVSSKSARFGHVYQVIDPERLGFKQGDKGHIMGFADTDVEVRGAIALFDAFQRQGKKPVLLGQDLVMTASPSLRSQLNFSILAIQTKFPWVKFSPTQRAKTPMSHADHFQMLTLNNALDAVLAPETHAYPVYLKADATGMYQWHIPKDIRKQGQEIHAPEELYQALGQAKPVTPNPPDAQ